MPDELKIFGKVFDENGTVAHGLFVFGICEMTKGHPPKVASVMAWMQLGRGALSSLLLQRDDFTTKELARDYLETEARRIMRECFEMLGVTINYWHINDGYRVLPATIALL